jgi:hypothetical protein
METNKRRIAGRLFCLALGALFVLAAAGYVREIRGGREAIARHRNALAGTRPLPSGHLARLEARLAEAREAAEGRERATAQRNSEDSVAAIRAALRTHAVGVEGLRTLSAGEGAATELVLVSAAVNFLAFLQAAADLPLPLSYVSMKPSAHAATLDITVRFSHGL